MALCLFRLPKLPFLGHIVSAEGISLNPENVQAIKDTPVPTCLSEMESFMDMVTFYTTFLPKLATVAEPLCALECGDAHFTWSSECKVAFDAIRDSISTHVLLALFGPRCPTHLNTDTSAVGLRATLTQIQGGKEVTISCTSHTLSTTERNYSAVEKEALACMWAVEKFDKYLLGVPFTLHTDQHALRQVLGSPTQAASKRKTSKFIHWAECLSAYNFMLAYCPGKVNFVPGMLSWLPLPTQGPALQDTLVTCLVKQIRPQGISLSDVKMHTEQDSLLPGVCHFIQSDWLHKSKIPQDLLLSTTFGTNWNGQMEYSYAGATSSSDVTPGRGSTGGTHRPSGHGANEMQTLGHLLVAWP